VWCLSLANRSTAGVVLASNMKIFQDIKHLSVRLGMEEGLRNKRRYITFDLSKKFWPFVFLRNKSVSNKNREIFLALQKVVSG